MTNPEIDDEGNKSWRNAQGQLHRDVGPAVECVNGDKFWFQNGKLHREDGPAEKYVYGSHHGMMLHASNGITIQFISEAWFINGK